MKYFLRKCCVIALCVLGFFTTSSFVRAVGEDCCVLYEADRAVSCRVSGVCNAQTTAQYPASTSEIGNPGVSCRSENDGQARIRVCTKEIIISERSTSCGAEALCNEALVEYDNCENLSVSGESNSSCARNPRCFVLPGANGITCVSKEDRNLCSKITDASLCGPASDNSIRGARFCRWLSGPEGARCVGDAEAAAAGRLSGVKSSVLPQCAIQGTCRSIRDLEDLAFKVVELLFSIIGAVSFAFFIYGGVVMISSFGNSDQFSKGKAILVAAVTGIIISFSAYLLIGYLFTLLGIEAGLRGGIQVSFLSHLWL